MAHFAITAALALALVTGTILRAQTKTPRPTQPPPVPAERVDINHADLDELIKVPGLTRPWAERIVRFRPYHSKQDLMEEGILSSEVYRRIKDYVIAHRDDK